MERYFHKELDDLRSKLILIGEKATEAARMSTQGFLESDMETIKAALKLDDSIDELESEISHAAVRYITLRGPVSTDVRLLFLAIKASHDFERAGDEAHSIAKKTRSILNRDGRVERTVMIEEMAQIAIKMMEDAITCFVEEDASKALAIIKQDKAVDRLNRENFSILSSLISEQPALSETNVEIILISKSIERISDHAKNLAEEVIYLLNRE